jgi:micrococcal nuclease
MGIGWMRLHSAKVRNRGWFAAAVVTGILIAPAALDPVASSSAAEVSPQAANLVPARWTKRVPKGVEAATVEYVVDGDTVHVIYPDGRDESVRLILVDTPETVYPGHPVECYGPEASAYAKAVMPEGSRVFLEQDVQDRDRYGRELRYVWVKRGSTPHLVNESLAFYGYGTLAVYPPDVKYQSQIAAAEQRADRRDRGLWGAC